MSDIAMQHTGIGLVLAVSLYGPWHPVCAQSANYTFKLIKPPINATESLVAMNSAGAKLFQRNTAGGIQTCLLVQGSTRTFIRDR
jgi:hypothetical protein